MKKIVSILLTAAMLLMSMCISVNAAEKSENKIKLESLIESLDYSYMLHGYANAYARFDSAAAYKDGKEVLNDPNSTDWDYEFAYKRIINANVYGDDIWPSYAKRTYDKAIKEQNYNNWYSEADWADYQNKLADLKSAIDNLKSDNDMDYTKELTLAFQALLKTYNRMTNEYKVMGDVDKDGDVTVKDATLVMKYLVQTENLTGAQKMLTGAEYYDYLSVSDATRICKYIVGLIDEFPNNKVFLSDINPMFMSENLLTERLFNYNICPRRQDEEGSGYIFKNGYTGLEAVYGYLL